jgi:hypothetical protein
VNQDGTNNDRPMVGRDDMTRAIVSQVDERGVAVRNGTNGEKKVILDGSFQYIRRIGQTQTGLFLEIYNLLNQTNFGNPSGARNSNVFLIPTAADNPRTAQVGVR